MPLLRQLEFAFRSTGILPVGQPGVSPGELVIEPAGRMPAGPIAETAVLLQTARELLQSVGATRLARELRVEWHARLKTAAGRADYRQKLILLNPLLLEHPAEIDRTLRHELAHILAQFRAGRRRVLPHGAEWRQACVDLGIANEKRCHNLPFPAKTYAARFVYRCPNCRQEFPRVRRLRRAVACLACCRKHNGGHFDPRFRLKLSTTQHVVIPSASEGPHPR
jgi:predicted SprT family Zn-dependent metalloprotease